MNYVDYLGNVTRLAVELVNAGHADELSVDSQELLEQHVVRRPTAADLKPLLPHMSEALQRIVDGTPLGAVNALLERYPPDLHLSDHDGAGHPHIHFARNGLAPRRWIGQTVAAALAHVASGDPGLTLGRCAAEGCTHFFVDQSRNRTRRFCGNTCASRTTVAAYRTRTRTV
ncbi:CGNR zinc finger domain-containing protein [Asanoa sp. NPDC049518]|uniref:CGNR zinc finger domain-containing protein n=1 Tax=unclassified Asanoa TaxID=2685164 RepID=UPI00343461F6